MTLAVIKAIGDALLARRLKQKTCPHDDFRVLGRGQGKEVVECSRCEYHKIRRAAPTGAGHD